MKEVFERKKQEKIDFLNKENIDNLYQTDIKRMTFMK